MWAFRNTSSPIIPAHHTMMKVLRRMPWAMMIATTAAKPAMITVSIYAVSRGRCPARS